MLVLGPTNQRPVMFPWWTDDRHTPSHSGGALVLQTVFIQETTALVMALSTLLHNQTLLRMYGLFFSSLYQRFVWAAFGWFWFHRVDGNMFPTGWSHVTIGNNEIDVSSVQLLHGLQVYF